MGSLPTLEIQRRENWDPEMGPSQPRTCHSVNLGLDLGDTISVGDLAGLSVGGGGLQGGESEARRREGTQAGEGFH